MAFSLKRPILVGGLGLTVGGWLWESLHFRGAELGGTVIWGAIALGSGIWWWQQRSHPALDLPSAKLIPADRETVKQSLTAIATLLDQLSTEAATLQAATLPVNSLHQRLSALRQDLDRRQISLSILGGKTVGKTTLARLLLTYLTGQTPSPETLAASEPTQSLDPDTTHADLVVFVTTGDLMESEFQKIQESLKRQQRVLLVFNKQDQYLPADRMVILQQLRDRTQAYLAAEDVVAIATNPAPVIVRQYQPDGSLQERVEQSQPDIAALTERISQILKTEGQPLILNTVQRQAQALKTDVLAELNRLRRDRALPVIEQSQWIAAAAAFANPVASLDLVATAAINTQLILDLGALYQQPFSFDQAKMVAGTLAGQMVKLGLVEMSSQAIAPLLKSHAMTYVAGGLLQGVSAAYLTHLAGLSLVEYFEDRSQILDPTATSEFSVERLTQKLKAVFQDNQRTAFLQTLVKQSVGRLLPSGSSAIASNVGA
jgi:hypothetical protein